jgi:haloalkane dehalogenase
LVGREQSPKLFINAEPCSLLLGRFRDFCRTWPNQDEIPVHGDHFAQEHSPAEIARPLQHFLRRVTT